MKSFGLANARLALGQIPIGQTGRAEVALWIRNIGDIKHANNFIDFGPGFGSLTTAFWDEPRTYGGTISVKW